MSEPSTATSTTTAPATETPAAAPAPAPKTFAQAKAANIAKFVTDVKGETPSADPAKPADGKTETAEVDADATALQATTQLSRENRILKKKLADLEALKPKADTFAQVEQHRSAGKRLDAFRAAGFTAADFEALVEETIAEGNPSDPTSETTKQVLAKVDALTAKVEATEKEKADQLAAEKAAAEAKSKEGGLKAVEQAAANTKLADGTKAGDGGLRWHYVHLVGAEAHAEVLEAARAANQKAAKELGRPVTQKEFEDVIFPAAMDHIEAQHAERAAKYGASKGPRPAQEKGSNAPKNLTTKPAQQTPRTIDGSTSRASATPTPNNDNKTGKRSFKEAKAKVLEQFAK